MQHCNAKQVENRLIYTLNRKNN